MKYRSVEQILREHIAEIKDFPSPGIIFRDLTPILADSKIFTLAIDELYLRTVDLKYNVILSPESRGFWFGLPLATKAQVSVVPVRKPGKLPRKVLTQKYELEYDSGELQIHADAIKPGSRVLIVDDLIATGGTVQAIIDLVKKSGSTVVGCAFCVNLENLPGSKRLKELDIPNFSLVNL